MGRITKCRQVCMKPKETLFQPQQKQQDIVILTVEELEALRLVDFEESSQDLAACKMNISRGTLQRILYSARYKVAKALTTGQGIKIEGGNYEILEEKCSHRQRCKKCRFECTKGDENYE
ncbi:MAG: DUF134 domain-containing protein [Cellulosilyticaceae bacterium]